jgi:hypothetical protein
MGQAKRRGTFEERRAQAVEVENRRQKEAEEREIQRREERARRIAALPPEQRREELLRSNRPRRPFLLTAALATLLTPS